MQAPTHIISGVILQKILTPVPARPLRYALLATTALLSHGVLDRLARLTYHPPDPLWNDWFWVSFHTGVGALSLFLLYRYWKEYKLGILLSVLPDFDWLILHPARILAIHLPFGEDPGLHHLMYRVIDNVPFLNYLKSLPERNLERHGAIIEIALLGLLVLIAYGMDTQQRNMPSIDSKPATDVGN